MQGKSCARLLIIAGFTRIHAAIDTARLAVSYSATSAPLPDSPLHCNQMAHRRVAVSVSSTMLLSTIGRTSPKVPTF